MYNLKSDQSSRKCYKNLKLESGYVVRASRYVKKSSYNNSFVRFKDGRFVLLSLCV